MVIKQKHIKLYKKLRKVLFSVVNFFFLNPLNLLIFSKMAKYGYGGNTCLRSNFLPLPVHFYSPVPDVKELKERKVWDKKSPMSGINFKITSQLALLKKLGKSYAKECNWPVYPSNNNAEFFTDNNGFSYACAAILYSTIREFKPKRIIEIGSGSSSKVISQAISTNRKEGNKVNYTIIDPYPGDYVKNKVIKYNKLIKKNVETTDPKLFKELGENDILFIDSSHIVKIGNDVNFLYLEVLPLLKQGVIIHIHDISLPYEYSKIYATVEENRQFWTEQYLLQAFLINNQSFEVLLAMHFIMKDYIKEFRKAFPGYDPKVHLYSSGSFWIRSKKHEK